MGTVKAVLIGAFAALALIGCAKKEPILPGERENIREVLQTEARRAQAVETPVNRALPLSLPPAEVNAEWRQRPGTPIAPAVSLGRPAHAADMQGATDACNPLAVPNPSGAPPGLPWALLGLSEAFPESAENLVAKKYRKSHPKLPKMEVKSIQKSMKFVIR